VHDVSESLNPHRLSGALFRLAMTFTSFYERCQVLKAEDDERRRSRLMLCDLSARTLRQGLALLGIEAPDRM
jgi:arginyl-tRNA synthetase